MPQFTPPASPATPRDMDNLVSTAWLAQRLGEPNLVVIDASAHLADLGVDSLQVVELKFNLDQLLGEESDVAIIIANPTIRELALHSVRSARALT